MFLLGDPSRPTLLPGRVPADGRRRRGGRGRAGAGVVGAWRTRLSSAREGDGTAIAGLRPPEGPRAVAVQRPTWTSTTTAGVASGRAGARAGRPVAGLRPRPAQAWLVWQRPRGRPSSRWPSTATSGSVLLCWLRATASSGAPWRGRPTATGTTSAYSAAASGPGDPARAAAAARREGAVGSKLARRRAPSATP